MIDFSRLSLFIAFCAVGAARAADVKSDADMRSLARSSSGQLVAVGADDGRIHILSAGGEEQRVFQAHREAVAALAFAPGDDVLASAGLDGKLKIWNPRTGALVREHGGSYPLLAVAISRSGDLMAAAGEDGKVRVWRLPGDDKPVLSMSHNAPVNAVAISPSGEFIASAGEDGVVKIWETAGGNLARRLKAGLLSPLYALAFAPSGQTLASAGSDSRIRLWRMMDGVLGRTLDSNSGAVLSLGYSPSGDYLLSGGREGFVKMWDAHAGSLVKMFEGGQGPIVGVAFSSEGGAAVSASKKRAIEFLPLPEAAPSVARAAPAAPASGAAGLDTKAADALLAKLPKYKTKRPNAYGVIIGIEKYRDLFPAEYASRDAQLVRNYFEKALGIPAEHIVVRGDDRASLGDLRSFFESWLKGKAGKDSEVFVYFSGHGTASPLDGMSYLVPYDALPETIREGGYSVRGLYAALERLPIKRALVILDTCFSGAGGPRTVLAKGTRPIVPVAEDEALASGKISVITASAVNQISGTHPNAGHGLLTYHLARGLRGEGDSDGDGKISLIELYGYVLPKVLIDARKAHREQEPKLLPGVGAADAWGSEPLAVLEN